MFLGKIYDADDLATQHLPMRFFYKQCLVHGDSFLWLPNLFCGYYAHGEGQTGMCHPFHWILYRVAPLAAAFNIELAHSYPFMLAGMFFFLRRQRLALHAAMFGAFAFAFSGYNMSHYVHMHVVAIVAQLPWLLLSVDVALRSENRRWAATGYLGVGLLLTSQLLLGHPQHVWFSLLAWTLYAGYVAPPWRSGRFWLLGLFSALGIMAAAVQLLPSWDVLSLSVRAEPTEAFRFLGSLHPLNLVQVVAPHVFNGGAFVASSDEPTHEFVLYNGALAPVLAMLLWIREKGTGALQTAGGLRADAGGAVPYSGTGQIRSPVPIAGPCAIHRSLSVSLSLHRALSSRDGGTDCRGSD